MNCGAPASHLSHGPRRRGQEAVSLLAWLGVLAILVITATLLLPELIRDTDFRVARQETATLSTLGKALESAVKRHAYIPSHTDWVEFVAAEAGMGTNSVANNARRQPRLLVIDTNGWFNTTALPYSQPALGTLTLPLNARVMIISSLGRPLPFAAGVMPAAEFSALWRAAEGTASFPTTGLWAGWTGRSDDVRIERVNLSAVFVSLYICTYHADAAEPGWYAIGTNTTLIQAPVQLTQAPLPPRYYISGTLLSLYHKLPNQNLDSRCLLLRDSSFMYQTGMWRSSAAGGSMPGGVDISGVVQAFLTAVPNTQARYGETQQRLVVESMMRYMSNYNRWADSGFTDTATRDYLVNTVQPAMIATAQELFQGSYYPTNASGPQ